MTKIPQPAPPPPEVVSAEIRAQVKEIVFGTRIARVVENETPGEIVQITRERIWHNLSSYLTCGDWLDRRRTAEEIDAEETGTQP